MQSLLASVRAALVASLLLGCDSGAVEPTSREPVEPRASASAEPKNDGVDHGTLKVDGRERAFTVYLPKDYDPKTFYPAILAFHGAGATPESFASDGAGIRAGANDAGYIAVFPRGAGKYGPGWTWNAGYCCGTAAEQGVDDVKFVSELVSYLLREYSVNINAIHAVGFSNGAMLAQRLLAEIPEKIASAVVVGGTAGGRAGETEKQQTIAPKHPKALMVVHALNDTVVPFHGGHGTYGGKKRDTVHLSVEDSLKVWTERAECGDPVTRQLASDVRQTVHPCLKMGVEVTLLTLRDAGHSWPRMIGKKPFMQVVTDFFRRHRQR